MEPQALPTALPERQVTCSEKERKKKKAQHLAALLLFFFFLCSDSKLLSAAPCPGSCSAHGRHGAPHHTPGSGGGGRGVT